MSKKSKTTTPEPRVVIAKMARMAQLRHDVMTSYRWVYGIATTRGPIVQIAREARPPQEGDDQPLPKEADPTGEMGTDGRRAAILRSLPLVAAHVNDALTAMETALTAMQKIESRFLDVPDEFRDWTERPRPVDSYLRLGELEESRVAKERRESRNEGWGTG